MPFNPIAFVKNLFTKYVTLITSHGRQASYTSFGDDIYASETVRQAIASITSEFSKIEMRHIETDLERNYLKLIDSEVQYALHNPNPLMTSGDYLSRLSFSLSTCKNAWVYNRVFDNKKLEFWPLSPTQTTFLRERQSGKLFVQLAFSDGTKTIFDYSEVTHIRTEYGADDYMGGTGSEAAENETLIKTLETEHLINAAISKLAQSSLQIAGFLRAPVTMDVNKQRKLLEEFEAKVDAGKSGIVTTDPKADYIPVSRSGSAVDTPLVSYVDSKILRHWRVAPAIVSGDYSPAQHRSFFQSCIEPIAIAIAQAKTKSLRALGYVKNNEQVELYTHPAAFMENAEKNEMVKEVGGRGALTNNQILALYGLPPYEGGDVRLMSLNYINVENAAAYQLNNISKGKETTKNE